MKSELSWKLFNESAVERNFQLPVAVDESNRLLAATQNFFVVAGLGSFVEGYLIVTSKGTESSFAEISEDHHREFLWLVESMKDVLNLNYAKSLLSFEHGMCGCLDHQHAHLHLMPLSHEVTESDMIQTVNKVLEQRAVGIEAVEIKEGLRLEGRADIVEALSALGPSVKTFGRQFKMEHFDSCPSLVDFLQQGKNLAATGSSYVYFDAEFINLSWLAKTSLGSQFGREVAYTMESKYNKELQTNNTSSEDLLWKWQDHFFHLNILKTMGKIKKPLSEIHRDPLAREYGYKTFI